MFVICVAIFSGVLYRPSSTNLLALCIAQCVFDGLQGTVAPALMADRTQVLFHEIRANPLDFGLGTGEFNHYWGPMTHCRQHHRLHQLHGLGRKFILYIS